MTYASLSSLMTRFAMMSCLISTPNSPYSTPKFPTSNFLPLLPTAYFLVDKHTSLAHPVDLVFEVLALPEPFEDEEQPEQILVHHRDVRGIELVLRAHVLQRVRILM